MHLNKFLAHTGTCSRRNAVELIKSGKVKVNGVKVLEPAHQVHEEMDIVTVNSKRVKIESKLYILLNKPKGYVTTVSDDKGRQTVLDLLGSDIRQRVYPVGRLDRETTGILLLTNDGELTQKLAHPKYEIQKTYIALLDKPLAITDMERIKEGIRLDDSLIHIDSISYLPNKQNNHVRVALHSGKYRVIRRIFEKVGYNVIDLDRVKFASITKEDVHRGMWRFLRVGEIKKLKELIATNMPKKARVLKKRVQKNDTQKADVHNTAIKKIVPKTK